MADLDADATRSRLQAFYDDLAGATAQDSCPPALGRVFNLLLQQAKAHADDDDPLLRVVAPVNLESAAGEISLLAVRVLTGQLLAALAVRPKSGTAVSGRRPKP